MPRPTGRSSNQYHKLLLPVHSLRMDAVAHAQWFFLWPCPQPSILLRWKGTSPGLSVQSN